MTVTRPEQRIEAVDQLHHHWNSAPPSYAAATRQVLAGFDHIDGVVLICGNLQAQSQFIAETTRSESGEIGIRRVIYPLRVRELGIVPTNDQGKDDADLWLALYDAEPAWLAHTLDQAKLASPEAIYGASRG